MKCVNYYHCVAIKQLSEEEWIFYCKETNKRYSNNLRIALNYPIEIKEGAEFTLDELAFDASDIIQ